MALQKRALGQSGIIVSCLGLGTVKFGRNQEVKYPTSFPLPSDDMILNLLNQAEALGINFLDTAPAYGISEQRIGRLLTRRQDWVICTKVGEEFVAGKSFFDFSGSHIKNSVERSLRNLKTDYLDLVLVHSDGNDTEIIDSTDCLETLTILKEAGVIRAIGMSIKSVEGGVKAAELTDAVMVTYNPNDTAGAEVIDYASKRNKGVIIKKALNSGHGCEGGVRKNIDFSLNHNGVSSIVFGTINADHLASNVACAKKVLGE
jgi:aryl-alcohol dehydrogenase-like predicted oxidoreductase